MPAAPRYTFPSDAEHSKVVPPELASVDHWITWVYEEVANKAGDRKLTKVPYNPHNGRKASSTDSTTWGTLQEAYTARARYHHSGIGFVVTEQDRIVGIDLDHCLDPVTHEPLDWADGVISTLDSYTEISPSGEGIRIFARGDLPAGRRKRGDVEMYSWGRFLTVTGNHLPSTPRNVIERTDQIAQIHAQYLSNPDPTAALRATLPPNGNGKHAPTPIPPPGGHRAVYPQLGCQSHDSASQGA